MAGSAGVIDNVDGRTQLAGHNRVEILTFHLLSGRQQRFGMNVFKVREVIPCPSLSELPNSRSNPALLGVASVRGGTIPVIDLARAIQLPGASSDDSVQASRLMIVAELNMRVQGFVVAGIDGIENLSWDQVKPPPSSLRGRHYLTATVDIGGDIVGIIDVERVLAETTPEQEKPSSQDVVDRREQWQQAGGLSKKVLVADDSALARKQLTRCLDELQVEYDIFNDGQEVVDHIEDMERQGISPADVYGCIISDIEMPRLDGYTLVQGLKQRESTREIKALLHSSLTGTFNHGHAKSVGADGLIEKFSADRLATVLMDALA